jgi:Rap1a immunity proteins
LPCREAPRDLFYGTPKFFICSRSVPLTPAAHGGDFDGNELQEECTQSATFCQGYVAGVFDAEKLFPTLCVPDEVRYGQLVDVVTQWLRDHPERRHDSAVRLVVQAINEKFPCKDRPLLVPR